MDHEPPAGSLARCWPFALGQELTCVSQFGLGSARSGSACPRACSSRWRQHSRSTLSVSSPSSGSLAGASAAGLAGRHMHPGMEIVKHIWISDNKGIVSAFMMELPLHLGDKEAHSFLDPSSSCILHSLPCPQRECIDAPEQRESGFLNHRKNVS